MTPGMQRSMPTGEFTVGHPNLHGSALPQFILLNGWWMKGGEGFSTLISQFVWRCVALISHGVRRSNMACRVGRSALRRIRYRRLVSPRFGLRRRVRLHICYRGRASLRRHVYSFILRTKYWLELLCLLLLLKALVWLRGNSSGFHWRSSSVNSSYNSLQ